MSANFVPVIYDRSTKQVKRWAVLDFDSQLNDPAFGPRDVSEVGINIPLLIYRTFRNDPNTGYPALYSIQNYVRKNT